MAGYVTDRTQTDQEIDLNTYFASENDLTLKIYGRNNYQKIEFVESLIIWRTCEGKSPQSPILDNFSSSYTVVSFRNVWKGNAKTISDDPITWDPFIFDDTYCFTNTYILKCKDPSGGEY